MREQDNTFLISELTTIYNSQALRQIMSERKIHHQQKANEYVRAGDLTKAAVAVGKLDDIDKFYDVLQMKITNLKGDK